MSVVLIDGPSGKLPISGLRSKIFAQEVPRKYWWAEPGLCPALPVFGSEITPTHFADIQGPLLVG